MSAAMGPATTDAADAARRGHRHAVAMMLVCTLLWSLAGVFTRLLERAQGFEVAFWRSVACALFVALALTWRDGTAWVRRLVDSGRPGALSGAMWAVMFTCYMLALTMTTVANTMVVMATAPLLAALLGRIVLGTRVPARSWLAIAVAALGIAWMAHEGLSTAGLAGMLVAFAIPVASAINIVNLKRAGTHVDLVPAVMLGAVISLVASLPLAVPFEATGRDLLILVGLGIFQLGLPCMLMVRAAHHLAPHELALLGLLEVVLGPLWAWIGVGERPSGATLQGGGLVLAALAINALFGRRAA